MNLLSPRAVLFWLLVALVVIVLCFLGAHHLAQHSRWMGGPTG